MNREPVDMTARWNASAGFVLSKMTWQGRSYAFESTGRHWEDEEGYHVLGMIRGGKVVELIFRLNPAGWVLVPPASSPMAA